MEGRTPKLFSALALEAGTLHRRKIDLSSLVETERAHQLKELDNGALWSTVPKYLFEDETFVLTVATRYPRPRCPLRLTCAERGCGSWLSCGLDDARL